MQPFTGEEKMRPRISRLPHAILCYQLSPDGRLSVTLKQGYCLKSGNKLPVNLLAIPPVALSSSKAAGILLINEGPGPVRSKALYTQGDRDLQQMASMTKILTAMVLADLKPDLTTLLTRTDADSALGSGANLNVSESISVNDAFYNLMLPSSNVTANMIARIWGGKLLQAEGITDYTDRQALVRWVRQMNAKCRSIGMGSALFTTPSGLGNNHASVIGALKMVARATRYPMIMRSWKTQNYRLKVFGDTPRIETISNTNNLLFSDLEVIGGKTGTLAPIYNLACVVSMPNNQLLLVVTLGAERAEDRFTDCKAMIDAVKVQYQTSKAS